MGVCVHQRAWVCLFYIWAFTGSLLLIYVSVLVHGPFFFLQTRKLSAKRKFLFLNLARTWYRLPLQFHPVGIILRLMASDSPRDARQASVGKCYLLCSFYGPVLHLTWKNGKQICPFQWRRLISICKNKCFYLYSIKHLFLLLIKKAIVEILCLQYENARKFQMNYWSNSQWLSLLYRHSEEYLKCCTLLGSLLWIFIVQNICNLCPKRRNGGKSKSIIMFANSFSPWFDDLSYIRNPEYTCGIRYFIMLLFLINIDILKLHPL